MKKLLFCCILLCFQLAISAQIGKKLGGGGANTLVGTWTYSGGGQTLTLVLYDNGSGEFDGAEIRYTTSGNKLSIINGGATTVYQYQVDGKGLKLSGGDLGKPVTFTGMGQAQAAEAPSVSSGGANNNSSILGAWVSNDIELDFKVGDDVIFNGQPFKYTINKKNLLIYNPSVANGKIPFTYEMNNGKLVLRMSNGEQNVFERKGNGNNHAPRSGGNTLLGTWEGQGLSFVFQDGRNLLFNGKKFTYTASGGTLTCTGNGGSISYGYEISQGHLLLNYNGSVLMLAKKGRGGGNSQAAEPQFNSNAKSGGNSGLLGSWTGDNFEATFMQGGRVIINGETVAYSSTANTITLTSAEGSMTVQYKISGNKMIVNNNGVINEYYRKTQGNAGAGATGGGGIDRSMVGKWVRMGATGGGYNSNGGSSYEEYFILNANGTYEYYNESSRSTSGNDQYGNEVFNGGAWSGGVDRGTWSVRGNVLIANSQRRGMQQYPFQKRNNKNNDPCIVIDGTEYVTQVRRAPW